MNDLLLTENGKKRLDKPIWQLVCFAMFAFWQMGFIYFVGPSLTIDGKTPLPIDMDNATSLIAVCYVLSIIWMIFIPGAVVWTQRIATGVALVSAVCLFLPLPDDALRLLIYVQIFSCCLMIGFETFLVVNYLSEKSCIIYLTLAYGVSLFMVSLLQNEIHPVTFPAFRFVMVAALVLLFIFFLKMPVGKKVQPRYVKKSDGITAPKKLLYGTYLLVFVCSLMAVSGPAISGEVTHGVTITYLVDAVASFVLYILYKKKNIHPFRLMPVLVGLGGLGFLLMFASAYVPVFSYIACGFIGFGMISCQMLPLYGAVIMKSYPSKYISPIIIGLALVAVIVQGSMVEIFRNSTVMLYLVYAVIMAVLVFLYAQMEPFFLFALRRRAADNNDVGENEATVTAETEEKEESVTDPLAVLTPKEREVAEYICMGYTNGDIARMMFISENTVKDHTKKIYPKMGVHSRFELAALVNKMR